MASIEEPSPGPRPIVPAPTAIVAFAGSAPAGPVDTPVAIGSLREYEAAFGAPSAASGLGLAVRDFFAEGGRHAVALRIGERGLDALCDTGFTLLCLTPAPAAGDVADELWPAALALCAECRALLLADPPRDVTSAGAAAWAARRLGAARDAAVYFPRLEDGRIASGAVAGALARIDARHGVWHAPAGAEATLAPRPAATLSGAEIEALRPVNALRVLPDGATAIWGARTLGEGEWKYVNLRRYFLFLEASLDRGTQWAVFEPNGERLWERVRASVDAFLLGQWRQGALAGITADEAWFVRCGRDTMTQDDLDAGRLVVVVGVAPLRPAEFVIIRIGQWTADRDPDP